MQLKRKNDLNLRTLEVFGSVMRNLTTVAAAEELGVSQPAVSNAIKGLEAQLGFQLFERTSRGLVPSAEARLFYEDIEPIFIMMRDIEGHVRAVGSAQKGRLRIAATPPLSQSIIPITLQRFLKDRRDVRVSYDVRGVDAVLRSVETGSADLGLLLGMESHVGFDIIPLFQGKMTCVMLPDHPLTKLRTVTPEDLAKHDFVGIGYDFESRLGALIRSAFSISGVPYQTNMEVRYCHTACVLTSAGLGPSVVDSFTSRFMQSEDLVSKPFEPEIKVAAVAIVREGQLLSRVASAFLEELKQVAKETP
jgi:DNA-binding transcriptional LysR family regulator